MNKADRQEYLRTLKQLIRAHRIMLSEDSYADGVMNIRVGYGHSAIIVRSKFNLVDDAVDILYWVGKPTLLGVKQDKHGDLSIACTQEDNTGMIKVTYRPIAQQFVEQLVDNLEPYSTTRNADVGESQYFLPCHIHEESWKRVHRKGFSTSFRYGYVESVGKNTNEIKGLKRWVTLAHPLIKAVAPLVSKHLPLYRIGLHEIVDKNDPDCWYGVAMGIAPAHPELHGDVYKAHRVMRECGVIPTDWTVEDVLKKRKEQLHLAFLVLYNLRNYFDSYTFGLGHTIGTLRAPLNWFARQDKWCEFHKDEVYWVKDTLLTPFIKEWHDRQKNIHKNLWGYFTLFAHKTRIVAITGYDCDGTFGKYSLTESLREQAKYYALRADLLALDKLLHTHDAVFPFRVYEDLRTWAVEVDLLPKDNDVVFGLFARIIKVENGVSKHAGDTMYSKPEEVQHLYKKSFARLCYAMYLIAQKHGCTLQFGDDLDRSVYDDEVVKHSRNVKEIINLMMIGAI